MRTLADWDAILALEHDDEGTTGGLDMMHVVSDYAAAAEIANASADELRMPEKKQDETAGSKGSCTPLTSESPSHTDVAAS